MSVCPNINHPDWKLLVDEVGEFEAYREFISNGDKIPKIAAFKTKKFERNEPFMSLADIEASHITRTNEWFKKNLPDYSPEWTGEYLKVRGQIVNAWGVFADNVIQVNAWAPKGTAYHEAFHAVFRNLLNDEEKEAVINEAKEKHGKPIAKELDKLRDAYGYIESEDSKKSRLSEEELEWIYYEEKLADDFAEFTNNLEEDKTIGEKILAFFKRIVQWFGFFKDADPTQVEKDFIK